jgi:hypothetical protein
VLSGVWAEMEVGVSGGHFDYQQYRITDVAIMIDELIASNDDESLDNYGNKRGMGYSAETISRFREASSLLRRGAIIAQRIDWLVSGDDVEDTFHRRLEEELGESQ